MTLSDLDRQMDRVVSGQPTATGRPLSEEGSLQCIAVYACVRVIAETIASLPFMTYRRLGARRKEIDPSHRLYGLLHDQPNPEMSAMEFREALTGHVALRGNGYSEIQRDTAGRPVWLWPLRPDQMSIEGWGPDNRLIYKYRLPDGTYKLFHSSLILHLRGFSSNGITGYSPVAKARQAIAISLAAEEYGGRFFGNDSQPGGVLKTKGQLSATAVERLKENWEEAHRGLSNKHRVAILEEGLEWQQVGLPNGDAQWLESRKFEVEEIARMFNMPLHKIQSMDRATFSNIEHQAIEFVTGTIRPWCTRWEQRAAISLLAPEERERYFVEHVMEGLLRGDIKTRYEAYAVGRNWGWLSTNDVRQLENMNPLPGDQGDMYLVPLNMAPADQIAQIPLPTDPVGPRGLPSGEMRELRGNGSAASRRRLGQRYSRLFSDAATRVVRREVADVRQAAERFLTRRDVSDLERWLEEYYRDQPASTERIWSPTFRVYGDAIAEDAAAEIDGSANLTPEDERFLAAYGTAFATNYADRSHAQLRQILMAAAAGVALDAVLTRLSEWSDRRAEKVQRNETVRLGNGMTRQVWRRSGIQKIAWQAVGKNCPYCTGLNGRTVGIEQTFLPQGEDFQPDGAEAPLKVRGKVHHPPAHGACDCGLRPG